MSPELTALLERARAMVDAMTPEQLAAMKRAQRESWIRAMTTPCEHGVLDFEQCGDCRVKYEPTASPAGDER